MLRLRILDPVGVDGVLSHMRRMGRAGTELARKHLADVPRLVVPAAKAGAPVDDEDGGQLRDSITGTSVSVRNGRVSVSVYAGGASLVPYLGRRRANVYAIVQETDHTLRHTRGHAGFLGQPFNRVAAAKIAELKADLDREAANVA